MIPNWIHLSQTAGTAGNYTITITADTNSQLVERLATLSVHGTGEHMHIGQNISIRQKKVSTDNIFRYKDDGFLVTRNPNSYLNKNYLGVLDVQIFDIDGNKLNILSNTYDSQTNIGTVEFDGDIHTMSTLFMDVLNQHITDIYLPDSVKVLNSIIFFLPLILTGITFPAGLEVIEDRAFDCSNYNNSVATSLEFPAGLKRLGSGTTFRRWYGITELELPEGFEELYAQSISYMSNLAELKLPSSTVYVDYPWLMRASVKTEKIIVKATTCPSCYRVQGESTYSSTTLYYPCGCDYSSWYPTRFTFKEFAFNNFPIWLDKTDDDYWFLKICCQGNPIPLNVTLTYQDFGRGGGEILNYTWAIPAGEGINTAVTGMNVQDFSNDYGNCKLIKLEIEGESGEYSLNGYHYFLNEDWCYDSIADALEEVNNEWGLNSIEKWGDNLPLEGQIP